MSKAQTKVTNIEQQRITALLTTNNYNDPWKDPDIRQERVFNHILKLLNKGYEWRLDMAMPLNNLAKNTMTTAEVFSVLQPRNEKAGDAEGIRQYKHSFYVLRKRLKRIPIMAELRSYIYTLAGGKRTAAHLLGIKEGYPSLCDGFILIPPEGLQDYEILKDLKRISDISNAEDENATRPMDMASYANSLRGQWNLLCKDPNHWASANMGNIPEMKVRQWAEDWLKETYSYEPVESTFTNIFNQVFSQDRGQVWDYTPEKIQELWCETFENQEWVKESTNGQICKEVAYSRLRQPFIPINTEWFYRKHFSSTTMEVGLVLRLDSKTDSISTVLAQKDAALKALAEYNKNENFIKSGAAVVTRVLIPAHICHPDDKLIAYEWVKSKFEFCKV